MYLIGSGQKTDHLECLELDRCRNPPVKVWMETARLLSTSLNALHWRAAFLADLILLSVTSRVRPKGVPRLWFATPGKYRAAVWGPLL
jgi:hypothetical protein